MTTTDRRIIVAGSGRCGTSLVMQMLDAGGVPCHGDWPAFEDPALHERIVEQPTTDLAGRAIKLLTPVLTLDSVRRAPATSWVWITRDIKQMAASQDKFVRMLTGRGYHGAHRRRLIRGLIEEQRAYPDLMDTPPHRCYVLRFEDIICQPAVSARNIAAFLDLDLDVTAMAAAVVPRSAACYDGLLETALLASREVS
ncbi:MAG: sulfotransferase [Chloroflexi bacterium]|nr:sulfotransferase [Chloroflexota bacterium]